MTLAARANRPSFHRLDLTSVRAGSNPGFARGGRLRKATDWRRFGTKLGGLAVFGAVGLLFLLAVLGGGTTETATGGVTPGSGGLPANIGKDDRADITGAGATFPAPLYQAWFSDYQRNVAHGVRVNYQSIGSGGGIQQFTEQTVNFGASDAPMSDAEMQKAGDVQHIPMVIGAVVVTYNLPGLAKPLQLDGPTVARIFLGDIRKWNDPAIAGLNAGARLPDKEIQTVHRSDGSGTSFVFTDWLSKVSGDWKTRVGANKNPNWPAGQGGKGNEGVTNVLKQTPNSIGYVELNYAIGNRLPYADIGNRSGKFVTPTIETAAEAAAGVELPEDYRVSITDAPGEKAYPVASFTYLLVRRDARCDKQRPLINMLWWVFHDRSAGFTAAELHYAPVPAGVSTRVEATLKGLTCDGQPVLPR